MWNFNCKSYDILPSIFSVGKNVELWSVSYVREQNLSTSIVLIINVYDYLTYQFSSQVPSIVQGIRLKTRKQVINVYEVFCDQDPCIVIMSELFWADL